MKRIPDKRKFYYNVIEIGLVSIFSIGLIFLAVSKQSILWFDESFSFALVKYPLKDIISLTAIDVHPPLYYLILKIAFIFFGDSIYIANLVSVFPSVLTLIFSTFFLKKNFSDKAAILFLLCFMSSYNLVFYSVEIRMYSWALFFVTMTAIAAWYVVTTNKKIWLGVFLLCAECAAYTHYYAGLAIGVGYLLLLCYVIKYDRKKIVRISLVALLAILLYLPWIQIAIQQVITVNEHYQVIIPNIQVVRSTFFRFFAVGNLWYKYFSFVNVLTILFGAFFCIVCLFFLIRKDKTQKYLFFTCYGLLSVISLAICTVLKHSIHYAVPVAGLVFFFLAIESSFVKSKKYVIILYVMLSVFAGATYLSLILLEQETNNDFKAFNSYLSSHTKPDDIIEYSTDSYNTAGYLFYLFSKHQTIKESIVEIPFAEVYDKVFNMEYVTYSELFDSDKFENSRILKIMRESEVDSCFFKNGYIEYLGSVECKSVKYNLYTKSFKKEE